MDREERSFSLRLQTPFSLYNQPHRRKKLRFYSDGGLIGRSEIQAQPAQGRRAGHRVDMRVHVQTNSFPCAARCVLAQARSDQFHSPPAPSPRAFRCLRLPQPPTAVPADSRSESGERNWRSPRLKPVHQEFSSPVPTAAGLPELCRWELSRGYGWSTAPDPGQESRPSARPSPRRAFPTGWARVRLLPSVRSIHPQEVRPARSASLASSFCHYFV